MRYPAAVGFYSGNREDLEEEIKECFEHEFGPGKLEWLPDEQVIAGIVPHAGYMYSGPCAAWFYRIVPKVDTYVILGTNHTGLGPEISLNLDDWLTPFGIVETDKEFGQKLVEKYNEIEVDDFAHMYEHSIEVQLPFLQYLIKDFKFVPIVLKELEFDQIKKLANAIRKTAEDLNRRIVIIASSDFTHHGPMYGYVLFRENVIENVRKLDLEDIEKILKLDTEGFLELMNKYNGTVCGYIPICVVLEYCKFFSVKGELLKYYNSGEITKDEKAVVGYASIAFILI